MNDRTCPDCHRKLAATSVNFYADKKGAYGLRSLCKRCDNARSYAYAKAKKAAEEAAEEVAQHPNANNTCSKCAYLAKCREITTSRKVRTEDGETLYLYSKAPLWCQPAHRYYLLNEWKGNHFGPRQVTVRLKIDDKRITNIACRVGSSRLILSTISKGARV